MKTYETAEIGVRRNKGAPRIWLDGERLTNAGFPPGQRYTLVVADRKVTLTVDEDGSRVVTAHRKNERELPVIDLNSFKAIGCFEGLDRVRVILDKDEIRLMPLASQEKATERLERLQGRLQDGLPLRSGSFCHGGGVLAKALKDGLADAGITTSLVVANDIDREVLFHASELNPAWNDETLAIAAPMQEIVTDDELMDRIGKIEFLEAGIPCTGASLSGRAKKHLSMAEADRNAGHLVVPFLELVRRLQPAVAVVENVPPYANTASAHLIRHILEDWGYTVTEAILPAQEFNCLEDRKRVCFVAVTAGLSFDVSQIQRPAPKTIRLADVMEDIGPDDERWRSYDYLQKKEERDIAAGKGFRRQLLTPADTRVGTIGSGYYKARSTEPFIAHPAEGDGRSRLLTAKEHARVKGIDPLLIEGKSETRAHMMLGNSVCAPVFRAVGKAIGFELKGLPTTIKAVVHLLRPAQAESDSEMETSSFDLGQGDLFGAVA